jgi:hypothetical protein
MAGVRHVVGHLLNNGRRTRVGPSAHASDGCGASSHPSTPAPPLDAPGHRRRLPAASASDERRQVPPCPRPGVSDMALGDLHPGHRLKLQPAYQSAAACSLGRQLGHAPERELRMHVLSILVRSLPSSPG